MYKEYWISTQNNNKKKKTAIWINKTVTEWRKRLEEF